MQQLKDTSRFAYWQGECDKHEALKKLEAMTELEFNAFLSALPARVGLLVRGGMADWREVLTEWYLTTNKTQL